MTRTNDIVEKMPQRNLVDIKIMPKEAALIKLIRDNPYGEIKVFMKNGEIARILVTSSHLINEQEGLIFVNQEKLNQSA